jgi:hypothetical protein
MERLLYELHGIGVERVFFESRTPSLNQRDAAMVAAMHSSGTISTRLWVEYQQPMQDPLLWAADAIAGAVTSLRSGDMHYPCLKRFSRVVDIAVR